MKNASGWGMISLIQVVVVYNGFIGVHKFQLEFQLCKCIGNYQKTITLESLGRIEWSKRPESSYNDR